jgi:hypothetical protein
MELWPLLPFILLTSGTAGAGNANFFFFETQLSPEISYGPTSLLYLTGCPEVSILWGNLFIMLSFFSDPEP